MLKNLSLIIIAAAFCLIPTLSQAEKTKQTSLYYSSSCSHCKKVLSYLKKHPSNLEMKNVSNQTYRQELRSLGQSGVPVLVVGNQVIVGADKIIHHLSQ